MKCHLARNLVQTNLKSLLYSLKHISQGITKRRKSAENFTREGHDIDLHSKDGVTILTINYTLLIFKGT